MGIAPIGRILYDDPRFTIGRHPKRSWQWSIYDYKKILCTCRTLRIANRVRLGLETLAKIEDS